MSAISPDFCKTFRRTCFAEVISALVLCVPPWAPLSAWLMMGAYITLIIVQIVGSLWIKKLSLNWRD